MHSPPCPSAQVAWIILPGPSSGFGQLPDSVAFTAVETYVTIGLVCELLLRAVHSGVRSFCRVKANMFDSVVAAVSVLSSVLIAAGLETPAELLVAEFLVIGRILFRLSRLLAISKSFQRQQQAAYRKLDINLGDTHDLSQPSSPTCEMQEAGRVPWGCDVEAGGSAVWVNSPFEEGGERTSPHPGPPPGASTHDSASRYRYAR